MVMAVFRGTCACGLQPGWCSRSPRSRRRPRDSARASPCRGNDRDLSDDAASCSLRHCRRAGHVLSDAQPSSAGGERSASAAVHDAWQLRRSDGHARHGACRQRHPDADVRLPAAADSSRSPRPPANASTAAPSCDAPPPARKRRRLSSGHLCAWAGASCFRRRLSCSLVEVSPRRGPRARRARPPLRRSSRLTMRASAAGSSIRPARWCRAPTSPRVLETNVGADTLTDQEGRFGSPTSRRTPDVNLVAGIPGASRRLT